MAESTNSNVPVTVNSTTGAEIGAGGEVLATNTSEIVVPLSERAQAPTAPTDVQSYGTPVVTSPPIASLVPSPPEQTLAQAPAAAGVFGIGSPQLQQLADFPPPPVDSTVNSFAGVQFDIGGLPLSPADSTVTRGTELAALPGLQVQAPDFATTDNQPVSDSQGYSFPGIVSTVNIAPVTDTAVDANVDPSIPVTTFPGVVSVTRFPDSVSDSNLPVANDGGAAGIVRGASGVDPNEAFPGVAAGTITSLPIIGNDNPTNDFNTLVSSARTAAQSQPVVNAQGRQANTRDWRVRLSLAKGAPYLYNAAASGDLLFPLRLTDGIIFPYTPQVTTSYQTNYNKTPLTHSNHQGLFYQNSAVASTQITGTFTAQDTKEADYLLATIHFLRTVGKMFYGQDDFAGAPPPLLFLSGFGEYQFNNHPCLLEGFTYSLPSDVDYIRARSTNQVNLNLLQRRNRQQATPYNSIASIENRLSQLYELTTGLFSKVSPGANPGQQTSTNRAYELGGDNPTYVPTKIEIQITLLPIQTRSQISKQFSVTEFARGNLLRGGFW